MGWTCEEDGHHEGFVVAVREIDSGRFRELGPGDHVWAAGQPVAIVQIGCDCGWRSARYRPPAGTTWSPNTVELPDGPEAFRFESQARELWRDHTLHHVVGQLADGTRLDALAVVP
jgi:hypothetical protein